MASDQGPPQQDGPKYTLSDVLRKLLLCTVYIGVSTVLIRFNKVMMQPNHFPFAMALSCCHMVVGTALCLILYAIVPSMFPAMDGTKGERLKLMKWFVPIGICFSVMLFGSNKAYVYCSVTLLQFMKEANVMIVFLISCCAGLQSINRIRTVLMIWVIASATVSVSGDLRFSWIGVSFQAVSQIAECIRVVMGEFVLTGRKLDPLTYLSFAAPISMVCLMVATAILWDPLIWEAFKVSWPLVLANSAVAFVLNVLVAAVIKELSAVGFVLTGLTKDIVIVVLSCIVFRETIKWIQWIGFVLTLMGVAFWSMMKINPDARPIRMLERVLCMSRKQQVPGEETRLLEKDV